MQIDTTPCRSHVVPSCFGRDMINVNLSFIESFVKFNFIVHYYVHYRNNTLLDQKFYWKRRIK